MHRIMSQSIAVFSALFFAIIGAGIGSCWLTLNWLALGSFRGIALILGTIAFIYAWAIVFYRIFLRVFPIPEEQIVFRSRQQFVSDVYELFHLFFFRPLLDNCVIPAPFMRLIHGALGAKIGSNSYSGGFILDPLLVFVGNNSLVGERAIVIGHSIEGTRLTYGRVRIGSNVTIGAGSVVLPNVTIDDGAIVGANAVVPKGTHIGKNEVWGGIPAKKIRPKVMRDMPGFNIIPDNIVRYPIHAELDEMTAYTSSTRQEIRMSGIGSNRGNRHPMPAG